MPGGVHFATVSSGVLSGCGATVSHELYCWPIGFTYAYYQYIAGTATLVSGPRAISVSGSAA